MAKNSIFKFNDINSMADFLNGAITGRAIPSVPGDVTQTSVGPRVYGLSGKTLIFTQPSAVTVTFTNSVVPNNPDPTALYFSDIHSQIQAAIATVRVKLSMNEGRIVLVEVAPSHGVAVTSAGTANTLLGFDVASSTVGTVYPPASAASPPTPPFWVWAYSGGENSHTVFVYG